MKKEKLNLNSIITTGKYNGKTVEDIIYENKKEILELVRKGFDFEEEVYTKAGYKHTIRDQKFIFEFVDKPKQKDTKVYAKDTENVSKIIESLSTIDNISYSPYEDDEEETYDDETDIVDNEFD